VCQLQPSLAIEPALLTNLVCKIRLRHTSGRKLGSMLQIDNMERLSHHRHCHDSIARCMLLRDWMKMLEVAQPGWLSPACLASRALLGPLSAIQGSWTNPRATSYLQPYSHAFPCRTLGCNCNACLCAWQLMMRPCKTLLQHRTFSPPDIIQNNYSQDTVTTADKICDVYIGLP